MRCSIYRHRYLASHHLFVLLKIGCLCCCGVDEHKYDKYSNNCQNWANDSISLLLRTDEKSIPTDTDIGVVASTTAAVGTCFFIGHNAVSEKKWPWWYLIVSYIILAIILALIYSHYHPEIKSTGDGMESITSGYLHWGNHH